MTYHITASDKYGTFAEQEADTFEQALTCYRALRRGFPNSVASVSNIALADGYHNGLTDEQEEQL